MVIVYEVCAVNPCRVNCPDWGGEQQHIDQHLACLSPTHQCSGQLSSCMDIYKASHIRLLYRATEDEKVQSIV